MTVFLLVVLRYRRCIQFSQVTDLQPIYLFTWYQSVDAVCCCTARKVSASHLCTCSVGLYVNRRLLFNLVNYLVRSRTTVKWILRSLRQELELCSTEQSRCACSNFVQKLVKLPVSMYDLRCVVSDFALL